MGDRIKSVRDLEVYKRVFDCAMKIFEITKNFPPEERYSLTDQIRHSAGGRRSRYFIRSLARLIWLVTARISPPRS